MGRGSVLRWGLFAALVVGLWVAPSWSDEDRAGLYDPHRFWASPYFEQVFTVEKARAQGYVLAIPDCVPGMGYHYVKPEEADAWFAGRTGGIQVLLYDETDFLVGVEYLYTDESVGAPTPLGMQGPMEGHVPGMPLHYEQHIYFGEPKCPEGGM